MECFKHNTRINFMRLRKIAAIISIVLLLGSVVVLLINGLDWGLDFTGGTQIHLKFNDSVNLADIREKLMNAHIKKFDVQSYGSTRDVLVTIASSNDHSQYQYQRTDHHLSQHEISMTQYIVHKIQPIFPSAIINSSTTIGAKVSKELASQGALAVLISLLLISVYISFRFEYRMALSAAIALIHDPILILGVFSLFHINFGLTALAALLTVIGYSLNDTIVVFDRIRENFHKMRKATAIEVVNASINQTLSRTIMTSALTLVVVLALLFLGGQIIRSFSIALVVGIVIGTYSSIYVAGALAIMFGLQRKNLLHQLKKLKEDLP